MKMLSIKGFENFLKQKFVNKMYIAKINKTYDKFLGKWWSRYNYMITLEKPGNVSPIILSVISLDETKVCRFGSQIIKMRKATIEKGIVIFYVLRYSIKPSFWEKVYNYFYVFM